MKYLPSLALLVIAVMAFRGVMSNSPVNFPLLLLLAVVVCGIAWAADKFFLAKKRAEGEVLHWGVEVPASIFTVLLVVFLLRSFVAEPFRIPSSSMRPGLVTGDFILVNKFSYGIRLPVLDAKIIPNNEPARGDVVVFKAPHQPELDFIKRVIGVPGDVVTYDQDKRLTVNGKLLEQKDDGNYSWRETATQFFTIPQKIETNTDGRSYKIVTDPQKPSVFPGSIRKTVAASQYEQQRDSSPNAWQGLPGIATPVDTCEYDSGILKCTVPQGQYLVLGDNRDNSDDGRYWGFVPDSYLRGKAFFIWFNWDDVSSFAFKRVFSSIQ